jgi:hypothetical protein
MKEVLSLFYANCQLNELLVTKLYKNSIEVPKSLESAFVFERTKWKVIKN